MSSLGREASILPPGPWTAKGDKVFAGHNVVAIIVCPHASEVAEALATFPARSEATQDAADAAERVKKSKELQRENADLESEVERLTTERELFAERVATLSEVIASLRGELARLKGSSLKPI